MLRLLKFKFTSVNYTKSLADDIKNISSIKSRISGSSKSPEYDLFRSFTNEAINIVKDQPGITLIRDKESAERALKVLLHYKGRLHAWDTEVIDIDVKQETPVGKGNLICCSAFIGPEVNFGNGPRLFIDNFAQNSGLIQIFKPYFENPDYFKVWHNYGFDRHIIDNQKIQLKGFGADTMHLARLLDPSKMGQEYSLANLSICYMEDIIKVKKQMVVELRKGHLTEDELQALTLFEENLMEVNLKTNMKKLFGVEKTLKSGSKSKILVFPKILQMHCNPEYLDRWILYSTLDAEVTFFLQKVLCKHLKDKKIYLPNKYNRTDAENNAKNEFGLNNQADIYKCYWQPLGELLTEMEKEGMAVDMEHVKSIKILAEQDISTYQKQFLDWVQSTQESDVSQFNPSSSHQLQQLLFAPCKKLKDDKNAPASQLDQEDEYLSDGRKKSVRKEIDELLEVKAFQVENTGLIVKDGRNTALKTTDMLIKGLGIKPIAYTPSGLPSTDNAVLTALVGNVQNKQYGKIYEYYCERVEPDLEKGIKGREPDPEKGIQACLALNNLLEIRTVEVLLNTFILPLLDSSDANGRVHTSLNINTETGRLSSRNPNLLNQPALDKDRYKIRKSFVAAKGNKFIVADYGQLELRVLAHMTNCKTMIDAFAKGGDFHSRTAITMYPKIAKEIEEGKLLLEWDKKKGEAPAPLLKEKYAAERKQAKTMNFSIAYGKTVKGFALDWGCSDKEAKKTIDAWFAQRQEVKQWQKQTQEIATQQKYTQTLIGRFRSTEKYFKEGVSKSMYNHGLRAAINTPIQGGAADIVIAAMVKIRNDETLKELKYKILLQIHDELILEGPEEHAVEALARVKHLMENPFGCELRLKLEVDAKIGNNWYECK